MTLFSSPTPFIILLSAYVLIHLGVTLASRNMSQKSPQKVGFNPDDDTTNCAVLSVLLIIWSLITFRTGPPKAFAVLSALLALRTLYHLIFSHFSAFLAHNTNLRRARIVYEQTGEKTDRSIPGYASFNTVMLSGVVAIVGVFTLVAVAAYGFTAEAVYIPKLSIHVNDGL